MLIGWTENSRLWKRKNKFMRRLETVFHLSLTTVEIYECHLFTLTVVVILNGGIKIVWVGKQALPHIKLEPWMFSIANCQNVVMGGVRFAMLTASYDGDYSISPRELAMLFQLTNVQNDHMQILWGSESGYCISLLLMHSAGILTEILNIL